LDKRLGGRHNEKILAPSGTRTSDHPARSPALCISKTRVLVVGIQSSTLVHVEKSFVLTRYLEIIWVKLS